jgi:dipeptidyl aminopeptidase/acylaminoacyl peptidase
MRVRRPIWFLAAFLLLLVLPALSAEAIAKDAGPAPLLDRELFFGDPEISGAQLSPDGKYLSFLKPLDGTRNVWVKKLEEPFDKARPITDDTKRPITSYFWSRDSKFVLYAQDQAGDENYNVFAVDPAAANAEGRKVPAARNLTDAKGARAQINAVPRSDPDLLYVGLNDRDAKWHDLYKVKISTGERTLVRKNEDKIAGWVFDNKDQLRLAVRITDNGTTEVLRADADKFTPIYSCSVLESCGPVRFHKDNTRVYLQTNKGDDVDLQRLTLLDPATSKEDVVDSDPEKRVDFAKAYFSDLNDELIATSYVDDKARVYFKDKGYASDYNWLKKQKQLSGKELDLGSSTKDERLWLLAAYSDVEPGERWLFDRDKKKLTFVYRVREKLPRDAMAEMAPVRYPSSDGLEIPAYLTLPKGVDAKNLPAIIFPHGGPWSRDTWEYDGLAQFLANRGYAVLQPNFRASTGYGKKFLNAGNKQWGEKMQDDLTWGVKYLVSKGIADPKKVGIMGGSYGGYATLAGVAFTPDVYAAGVSIVGPSNLNTLLESIPPYWEAGRIIFHTRMGDPRTPEGRAQLDRQSPLNSAGKIKTPLLVLQGANDPRVKQAESDQIVIALRDRGFPVEYVVAPDEGHGFARPINNMAGFAATEKFLAKHLGGRFQEGGTPETLARLKEITVDPKSVVLAKKVDSSAVGAPRTVAPLPVGTFNYPSKIEVAGQSIPISYKREIKQEGDTWVVSDTVGTPMGEGNQVSVLDKDTLTLRSRRDKQGPMELDVAVNGGKATGKLAGMGEPKPFDVTLGGPLFADGAGGPQVLAVLALAEGYETTYRNLDPMKGKETLHKVKVAGTEQVTVPAGSFDAWKLEVVSADGEPGSQTIWVDKASRKVVKVSAVLPQMNGAVLTSELAP